MREETAYVFEEVRFLASQGVRAEVIAEQLGRRPGTIYRSALRNRQLDVMRLFVHLSKGKVAA